jgi:hypothetical protein
MKPVDRKPTLRCAIYTRVSTEHGLEQEVNSLDNQREAFEAYVKSQAHEGWKLLRDRFDDGGYSGGCRRCRRYSTQCAPSASTSSSSTRSIV